MIKFHKGLNFSVFTRFNKVKNIDICYNYANFSKKSLILGMANGPLRISVLVWGVSQSLCKPSN